MPVPKGKNVKKISRAIRGAILYLSNIDNIQERKVETENKKTKA